MQNMWLTAYSLGIGCCWVSLDEKATRQTISLPDEQELIGALALGYMDEVKNTIKDKHERKDLSHITSYEKFEHKVSYHEESCHACLKLIPKSAAMSFEGEEYIQYFCGQDCYAEWQKRTKKWLENKSE